MKLNDKIEFIKNEVKSEIPTINAKDLFKKVNTNYVSFSSNPYKNNKLLFKPYIKFTFLIIIIISIIIGYNGLNIHIEQDNKQFNRNLGFASVSLVSLFNNSNNTNEIKINDKIEFVNMHMYSIELIIDNNFYYIESDNINYKNLIIYNYENIKYKIYYNIVKTSKNRYDLEIDRKSVV